MRLHKLSLRNWRGVDTRDLVFSQGVTLIEGPNEIGKSTIVEAISTLFKEKDSSKKQSVKAIKPVDQDVGSTVEVEVTCGDYRFVYAKTFNKTPKTTLSVLAPTKKQLTGGEAHQHVEAILAETVDMALWEALLVDQGEKVALVNLQSSKGLTNALDDAAGTASASDDTDLYHAARAEYEKYFSLKAGKSRFADEEAACEQARSAVELAASRLAEVESTAADHERSVAEVQRLKNELPRLKDIADKHAASWESIKALKDTASAKARELANARSIEQSATEAQRDRLDLARDVTQSQSKLAEAKQALEPIRDKARNSKEQIGKAQQAIADLRDARKTAHAAFELASADEHYLKQHEQLAADRVRLDELRKIAQDKSASLKAFSAIKVDDKAVQRLRDAENRRTVAKRTLSTAATTIALTAEDTLKVEIDGEKVLLAKDETATRTPASPLHLRLPGIASIDITPPLSVADLQSEFDDAEEAVSRLYSQYNVASLADAVTANERRVDAQRNLDRLNLRETDVMGDSSMEELAQSLASNEAECNRYLEQRASGDELPRDRAQASKLTANARAALASCETALDEARNDLEALQKHDAQLDGQLRDAEQNHAILEAKLAERETRLEQQRAQRTDAELASRAADATAAAEKLERKVAELTSKLDESSPESIDALLKNARSAHQRAEADLKREEQILAVLTDRLEQAQADGRFEAGEQAQKDLDEKQRRLDSIKQRAEAADLLWKTLNKHRDAARKTYVRPLKEAIERLGRIVFGNSFEIEIGDDWSVIARTLDGITLPFDYLSVGAKEQIGILVRLAAAQIVAKKGGVPLIIDDALGFSDPSRLETIGAAINAAGEDSQIIILTCTPGRFTHVGSAEVVRFD